MRIDNKIAAIAVIVIALAVFAFTLPLWITQVQWIKDDFGSTGPIGDTFGGIIGPGIGLIGTILTFFAFYVQYQANQQQRNDINNQRDNWQLERFENRFFELVKLHKENVNEMRVNETFGRECFVPLFHELKLIYDLLKISKNCMEANREWKFEDIRLSWLAYNCFFYGISESGEKAFIGELSDEESDFYGSLDGARDILLSAQKKGKLLPDSPARNRILKWVDSYKHGPAQGHAHQLGHYYRHLFQTAKYVRDSKILEPDQKLEYLKTLRAQLTNYEQLMLFQNAIVWFPEEWKELFTKFRFIKNIPFELSVMGYNPIIEYREDMIKLYLSQNRKKMFEGQGDIRVWVEEWLRDNSMKNWKW